MAQIETKIAISDRRLPEWLLHIRLPLLVGFHAALFLGSYWLAFLLRLDFRISAEFYSIFVKTAPLVVMTHVAAFWIFNTYHGWWRYVTFRDLMSFVMPLVVSALLIWGLGKIVSDYRTPGSILALNSVLAGALLTLCRSSWRIYHEVGGMLPLRGTRTKERALMISNHHDTLVLANQINSQRYSATKIVGILTTDRFHRRARRAGIPIVGHPDDAPALKERYNVTQVWLIAGSIPGPELLELKTRYDEAGLKTQVIPAATDRNPAGSFIPVREININDLLQRDSVSLDTHLIEQELLDTTILVTGAGGSIGSEICRQLLKFRPKRLILVDHRENSVFLIHNELLAQHSPHTELVPAVGDILDEHRMRYLFEAYRPNFVYHAAAHKHVGLMEENPGQAVQNNILGTKNVADIAAEFQVTKFVLVSTDKAVNPTSVMGCTKQIAERYILSLGSQTETRFIAVRFGNVLGSAGSVVPIFKEQIARGGPITITDPKMTRFFMTIPEASQLVIQAGCMGNGGEIFVLDMGEPVKIVDLARKMIRLAGLPDEAIQIRFTGARPGEKLFEELYFDEETMISTPHHKVFAAKHRKLQFDEVQNSINQLADSIHASPASIRHHLQAIVPEYHPTTGEVAIPQAKAPQTIDSDSSPGCLVPQ